LLEARSALQFYIAQKKGRQIHATGR
jgi:hypothetical protein